MASNWRNTEDIFNDLTEVTGQPLISRRRDLTAVTDRPPAVTVSSEDLEEMYVSYFGDRMEPPAAAGGYGDCVEPDLGDIKRMIDMVHEAGDLPSYDIPEQIQISKSSVVVTKLNPNVQEFRPKVQETTSSGSSLKSTVNSTNTDRDTSNSSPNCNSNTNSPSRTRPSSCEDVKEKSEAIKKEYIKISQEGDLKSKFARNIALQSLLNLHTRPADAERKLLTPDDFEATVSKENITPVETPVKKLPTDDVTPKQMKESIKKVENWMNPMPTNTLQPIPSQVTFKRKDKSSLKSVNSEAASSTSSLKSQVESSTKKFVPSPRAEEYYKKYVDNARAKEAAEAANESLGDRILRLIKEKEENEKHKGETARKK